MLPGQMMDFPLTVTHLLERARRFFPRNEVVTREADRSISRVTYAVVAERAAKAASALRALGVGAGDRVASLAWNHARHLELYLGVPAMGAVVHTLNLRLHPDEIGFIASHAKDKVIVVDACLVALFEKFKDKVPSIEHVIVVDATPAHLEAGYLDYDTLVAAVREEPPPWPDLAENS
ncbi:MAG TPA: AMP-binding protein, partial [Byssovorax sp.]